jgi:hypothetical protein
MKRNMMPSGIEWVGIIPETWKVVRGKRILNILNFSEI